LKSGPRRAERRKSPDSFVGGPFEIEPPVAWPNRLFSVALANRGRFSCNHVHPWIGRLTSFRSPQCFRRAERRKSPDSFVGPCEIEPPVAWPNRLFSVALANRGRFFATMCTHGSEDLRPSARRSVSGERSDVSRPILLSAARARLNRLLPGQPTCATLRWQTMGGFWATMCIVDRRTYVLPLAVVFPASGAT
jgi:hypothetical protein